MTRVAEEQVCGYCRRPRTPPAMGSCACIPPWFWELPDTRSAVMDQDPSELITGHVLWDLAVTGAQPGDDAEQRLAAAVAGHTDAYRRSRAISGIKLASLQLRSTDPERAQTTALAALEDMGQVQSKRALDDMRELSATAARHHAHDLSDYTTHAAQGHG